MNYYPMTTNSEVSEATGSKTVGKGATKIITITSGKGGVGKTNIAANLAIALRKFKKRVMILDADLGLANIDVILGLAPRYNLYHVLSGEKSIFDIIVKGPAGIEILPASSGIESMTNLSTSQKLSFMDQISTLPEDIDYFIIDTSAGISSNVVYFNLSSNMSIVVVTPEPTSITDAYALIKVLSTKYGINNLDILVNMVKTSEEGKEIYRNLMKVTDRFLSVKLGYLGCVKTDPNIKKSVIKQKPLLMSFPESPAGKDIQDLGRQIVQTPEDDYRDSSLKLFWNRLISSNE